MGDKHSLVVQPQARLDLEDIFKYTTQTWSKFLAVKYQKELFDYMNLLCELPTMGRIYPFGHKEFRKFSANKHIIFYRIENQQIIVVRILHSRMDYNEHL